MPSKDLVFNLTGVDVSASKAMHGVASAAEVATGRVAGSFGQVGRVIGGEFGEIMAKAGEGMEHLSESSKTMSGSLIVGGGVVAGLGLAFSAMGAADKKASDQLQTAVEASNHSWKDYQEEVENTIVKQEGFGHSAVDTQEALRKLTQATNDPQKAIESMGVTANLAAARHVSLSDASALVSRILGGGGAKTLKEYGITMATTGDKTQRGEEAISSLSKKLDGQASASMNNFSGIVSIARTRLEDWGAKVGQVAGPVLTVLGPAMMIFGTVLEMVKTKQAASAVATLAASEASAAQAAVLATAAAASTSFAVATDGTTVALGVEAVATDVATVSTEALNTVWLLSPVGLITAGIGLLIGVIAAVTLTTKSATEANVDYSASLAADNAVVGEAVRKQASKALADAGAIEAAKKLGLSMNTVTAAALGNTDAMKVVSDVTNTANVVLEKSALISLRSSKAARDNHDALLSMADAGKIVQGAVNTQSESIKASTTNLGDQAEAMGVVTGSAGTLAQGLGLTSSAYADLKASQDGATQASKNFKTQLDILNGAALGLDAAQVAVQATAQTMATAVAGAVKAGANEAEKAAARSMDISTVAGRTNHDNIVSMLKANADLGVAIVASEGDTVVAHNHAREAMANGEEAIRSAAGAAGLYGDQVDALVTKFGKIPPVIKISVLLDTQSADEALNTLNSQVNFRRSETGYSLSPVATHANGGTVMGSGTGISDSVPIMASRGEEIINARAASKWRPLLQDINAGRDVSIPGGGGSGGGFHIENFITQTGQSAAEIAANLGWISKWAT